MSLRRQVQFTGQEQEYTGLERGSSMYFGWCSYFTGSQPHLPPHLPLAKTWPQLDYNFCPDSTPLFLDFWVLSQWTPPTSSCSGHHRAGVSWICALLWPLCHLLTWTFKEYFHYLILFMFFSAINSPDVWKCNRLWGKECQKRTFRISYFSPLIVSARWVSTTCSRFCS